jgi:MFS family permease
MTEVGQFFAIFAIASLFGNLLSGAMTDKFGRRVMLLFGLVFSALSSLTMGFVNEWGFLFSGWPDRAAVQHR